jgi:CTP:molybdopterin cytidylyltransferase MocA
VKPIAGLVLAAGLGTRFGGRKLATPIDGRPMLQPVLDLAAAAALEPVVVVLGTDADELLRTCTWRSEIRVRNPTPEAGLSGSVRMGLVELERSDASRVVVLLGDQPFLTLRQLRTILDSDGAILVPRYRGAPGTPVVLDRSVWPLAGSLEGDRGFSQLFAGHRDLVSYVDVPGTNRDIDRRSDIDEVTRA